MRVVLIALMLVVPSLGFTSEDNQWFQRHAEGWFWYIDPPVEEEPTEEAQTPQPAPVVVPAVYNPKAKLEEFQEALENAQAQAIMHPTRENVMAYMYLQKQAMDRSQNFSEMWQQVVWTTPALDHTLVRPTSPKAVVAYYDERNENRKEKLQQLAKSHGLFYFFRESCPYCKQFSPILASFAKRHGFHVTAITMDGGATPGFPQPRRDNGTAMRLGVKTVPAVYLVEPKTRDIHPVSYGLLGPSELEERIMSLIKLNAGDSL